MFHSDKLILLNAEIDCICDTSNINISMSYIISRQKNATLLSLEQLRFTLFIYRNDVVAHWFVRIFSPIAWEFSIANRFSVTWMSLVKFESGSSIIENRKSNGSWNYLIVTTNSQITSQWSIVSSLFSHWYAATQNFPS